MERLAFSPSRLLESGATRQISPVLARAQSLTNLAQRDNSRTMPRQLFNSKMITTLSETFPKWESMFSNTLRARVTNIEELSQEMSYRSIEFSMVCATQAKIEQTKLNLTNF